MATPSSVQLRLFQARSRALRREGQNLRSLRLQAEKNLQVKAVLTHHAPGLSFFKKGERNLIIRAGGQHIGEFFITDYLPLRFERGYARAVLFYRPSAKYEEWKAIQLGHGTRDDRGGSISVDTSQNEPLVLTGALRESVLNRSYPVSRAANGRFSVVIRMPTPATAEGFRYSSNKEVHKVLRALPMKEVKALSNRLGRFITHQIGNANLKVSTSRQKIEGAPPGPVNVRMRRRLTGMQRESLRDSVGSRPSLRNRAPARRTLASQASYNREAG